VPTSVEPSRALVVADTPSATAAPRAGAATPETEQSATGGTSRAGTAEVLGSGNPTGRPGSGTAASLGSGSGSAGQPLGTGSGSSLAATTSDGRDGIAPEYGPYLAGFRRRIQEALEYPLAARRRGLAGTVELEVLLEPSGRVTAARVVSSSSHAVLDDAALRAVRGLGAEPFPERLPRKSLRIRIPLAFELR
jgi:protein TonB